jgi:beta-galactosidase
MVYISGRRLPSRTISPLNVRVYSNCEQVELFIGGVSAGVVAPSSTKVAVFPDVVLSPGENVVRAVGQCSGATEEDQLTWNLTP